MEKARHDDVAGYKNLGPTQQKILRLACENAECVGGEFYVTALDAIARKRLGYSVAYIVASLERWGCIAKVDEVRFGSYKHLAKRHRIVFG